MPRGYRLTTETLADTGALADADARSGRERLVVIGNGMVGHRFCQKLVELGAINHYVVTVFGEEPQPAYDRVHLTELLSGRSEESLLLSPREWYRDHGIDLRLNDPVVDIDRDTRLVRTASGASVDYDRLIVATGSFSFVPPIEGTDLPGVFVYRTIDDLRAIREHAGHARRAAVIGGGLLGLEAARALRDLGVASTIVEFAAGLMPAQLTQPASTILKQEITARGISVLTASLTTRISADGGQRVLHLSGGESLVVDLVVIAAGVRPRTELADRCGLERSAAGGIVVDDRLTTSDPHVYAIGECASHASRVYGLVAPGYAMADVLAANLAGGSAVFTSTEVTARLKLLDVEVATTGVALDSGPSATFERGGVYRLLRIERGRLVGALAVGSWPEFSRIQEDAARRRRIWPWQAARFERTGTLRPNDTAVADWPAHAVVCNCLSVTKAQIDSCLRQSRSLDALAQRTGASTLCGSCKPLLAELAGCNTARRVHVDTGLLAGSMLALIAAALIVFASPIPFVNSVQGTLRVDLLWRETAYRRVSGFTLLGLAALAASISVRKRWRPMAFGSFGAWRVIHAAVGTGTLAILAAHTGFRLGSNLNFVLMMCFLAVNLVGSLAGGVTALEGRVNRRTGRVLRNTMVLAHVIAVWPLPVLVAFHVLAAYYF